MTSLFLELVRQITISTSPPIWVLDKEYYVSYHSTDDTLMDGWVEEGLIEVTKSRVDGSFMMSSVTLTLTQKAIDMKNLHDL